jgi:hypothetical protein
VLRLKGDTTVVIGKWEEKGHLEELGIEGVIILKCILGN